CAIYTRKSNEEGLDQEFNSLDSQRVLAERYIQSQAGRGWTALPKRYDDGGFSGGNMDRPALTELLNDIQSGLIDCVVTYKLDRVSRSLFDFTKIIHIFDEHDVIFDTVTESFSSANPSGRLMVNMLLSFAQYERELAIDRVRDKISESKKKGIWMGGHPPLGYDVKDRKLVINKDEAMLVKLIYKRFLETESCRKIADELNKAKYRTKANKTKGGKAFDPNYVRKILLNVQYKGCVRHKENVYKGEQEAIIDEETWDRVQSIFRPNDAHRKRYATQSPAMLRGLIGCGACNCGMTPTSGVNHGLTYRYYACNNHLKSRSCRGLKIVPAEEIERRVTEEVLKKIRTSEVILNIQELNKANRKLSPEDLKIMVDNVSEVWNALCPNEQRKIVRMLIAKVDIYENCMDLEINLQGFNRLLLEFSENAQYA
ncbi:MAG: recombinase family protein, partial [Holosporaceae bacterium]|nr:recombinase family protein [Holosporaceae bacterium]